MKKFVIYMRAIPGFKTEADMTIVEVEGHVKTAMEDPSIMWVPKNEFKFSISQPAFLCGENYYSHSIYHGLEHARAAVETLVQWAFEFEVRKGRLTSFTEEDIKAKCAEVKEILLS